MCHNVWKLYHNVCICHFSHIYQYMLQGAVIDLNLAINQIKHTSHVLVIEPRVTNGAPSEDLVVVV